MKSEGTLLRGVRCFVRAIAEEARYSEEGQSENGNRRHDCLYQHSADRAASYIFSAHLKVQCVQMEINRIIPGRCFGVMIDPVIAGLAKGCLLSLA